jgi:PAS domain S-box-containing protein/diguanylate cyclase (GGDEF)-like protein
MSKKQCVENHILEPATPLSHASLAGLSSPCDDALAAADETHSTVQYIVNNILNDLMLTSRTDREGRITYVNDQFAELTGYSKTELIGNTHGILKHPEVEESIYTDLWRTIRQKKTWQGVIANKAKDGREFFTDTKIIPILDKSGNIIEFLATRYDISRIVRQQKKMNFMLKTSQTLNISNRIALIEHLKYSANESLAILDINSFKELNNFYGHHFGDLVLQAFVKELSFFAETYQYSLFHLNSDKFVLSSHKGSCKNFIDNVKVLQGKISKKSYTIQNKDLALTVSVALSCNESQLLETAEMALNYGKLNNLASVVYNRKVDLSLHYEKNLAMALQLKNAITRNQLFLEFQPIMHLSTGKISKYECLVRMKNCDAAIINPDQFIEVAKKSKQYHLISKRVVALALSKFKDSDSTFSINLSLSDILDKKFMKYFFNAVKKFSNPSNIIIELLETESVTNFDYVLSFIDQIKNLGCRIAIDDFGSGYSNFEYLLKFNPDFLKIDGSLIKNIHCNDDSYDIVEAIVGFAKKKKIEVIAEYVSESAIFDRLKKLDIEFAQGYYIGKPEIELRHMPAFLS